jgi:hypothetical protein
LNLECVDEPPAAFQIVERLHPGAKNFGFVLVVPIGYPLPDFGLNVDRSPNCHLATS